MTTAVWMQACFSSTYTWERCCLHGDLLCWDTGLTADICCSAYVSVASSNNPPTPLPPFYRLILPPLDAAFEPTRYDLLNCSRLKLSQASGSQRMVHVGLPKSFGLFQVLLRCLAQQPSVATIMDLYLGHGHSTRALLEGLDMAYHRFPMGPRRELFTIESEPLFINQALEEGELTAWNFTARVLNVTNTVDLHALLLELWKSASRAPAHNDDAWQEVLHINLPSTHASQLVLNLVPGLSEQGIHAISDGSRYSHLRLRDLAVGTSFFLRTTQRFSATARGWRGPFDICTSASFGACQWSPLEEEEMGKVFGVGARHLRCWLAGTCVWADQTWTGGPSPPAITVEKLGRPSRLFIVHGWSYPHSVKTDSSFWASASNFEYKWNPIDVICGQRGPLDLVVVEPSLMSQGCQKEWAIIEELCRPTWVVLLSTSLPFHAGWIQARLSSSPNQWHELLRGHVAVSENRWSDWKELLRLRSFTIFHRAPA